MSCACITEDTNNMPMMSENRKMRVEQLNIPEKGWQAVRHILKNGKFKNKNRQNEGLESHERSTVRSAGTEVSGINNERRSWLVKKGEQDSFYSSL